MGTGRALFAGVGGKLLLSGALLGAVVSIAGVGSYATFTDTTSVDQARLAAGTVDIALGAPGAENRLEIGASGLVAGDTIERQVKLHNPGSSDLGSLTLTTSATTSSILDTDATNGLQLQVDRCSRAWTEAGPPYAYTCAGTTTTVVASRPVIGSDLSLASLASMTAGGVDHLRVRLQLPATAGDAFQGRGSAIRYSFDGVQRTSESR